MKMDRPRVRSRSPVDGDFPLLITRMRGPVSIPSIIRMSRNIDEFKELLEKTFTIRSINRISTRTKQQSQNSFWFLYRRCVITGTLAKRVVSQNQKDIGNPKLDRKISKFFANNFKNEAMSYGIENEKKAVDIFFKRFKKDHKEPKLLNPGVIFYEQAPYIAGSPDAVFSCACCPNQYLVEVKCPFRLREIGVQGWKILEYFDEDQVLKKFHTYSHQITLYQGILGIKTAYFVIYAKDDIIVKTIEFDQEFFDFIVKNLSQYYLNHYLPTVIGKRV